jgi:hypothetical protein
MLTDESRIGETNHGNNVIFAVDEANAIKVGQIAVHPAKNPRIMAVFETVVLEKPRQC